MERTAEDRLTKGAGGRVTNGRTVLRRQCGIDIRYSGQNTALPFDVLHM